MSIEINNESGFDLDEAALAKLGRLEEARASAAKVLELHPTFRFSRQFAGVDCAPALAVSMGAALRMVGLPE